MRIEVGDRTAAEELIGFLRSLECSTTALAPHLLDVEFEDELEGGSHEAFDRIRLDGFLRAWNSLHPRARARLLDDVTARRG